MSAPRFALRTKRLYTDCISLRDKCFITRITEVFFFSLFFSGLFCSCTNSASDIRDYSRLEREPMLEADAIELVMTENGRVVVRVQAPTMSSFERDEKQFDEFPKGITVQSYASNGEPSASIRADYAIYQRNEKLWEARTRVVAVNEKGDSIQTEQIFWDENKQRVYTSANLRIRTGNAVLFGKGLESDDRFVDWEIKAPTGVIAVPSEAESLSTNLRQTSL